MKQKPEYVPMWNKTTKSLVDALIKHEAHFASYEKEFTQILLSNEPQLQQDRFYYSTATEKDKQSEFENGQGSEFISLDGLLLNLWVNQASKKLIPNPKEQYALDNNIWNNLLGHLKIGRKTYSTFDVVSDLLKNKPVVDVLMSDPATPYSLLGRVKILRFDANENSYTIYTRPTLIKPGMSPSGERVICAWERSNEVVEKSKKFFGI